MADETKKVLIDVDIKATQALKELTELRKLSADLRKKQAELDTTTAHGKEMYAELGEQIKSVNAAASERSKIIQSEIKQQNQHATSLNGMGAHLAQLKKQYRDLSAEQRAVFGKDILTEIQALDKELKEAEAEYGTFTRNVGNYAGGIIEAHKSLSSELSTVTEQLMEMAAAGQRGTDKYNELLQQAGKMKEAQDAVNQEIDKLSKGTLTTQGLVQSFNALVGVVGTVAASFNIFGVQSEELEKLQNSMNEFMVILQGLNAIQEATNKTSAAYGIYLKAQSVYTAAAAVVTAAFGTAEQKQALQAAAAAKAEAAKNAVMGKGSILTKAATAVQWAWNAALAANPIGAIIAAVALLVTGIGVLIYALAKSSDAEKEAAAAAKAYEEQAQRTAAAVEESTARQNDAISKRKQALQDEILKLIESGATEEEIAAAKAQAEEDYSKIQLEESEKREKALQDEADSLNTYIEKQTALLASKREGSKAYEEEKQKLDDLIKRQRELNESINGEIETRKEIQIKRAEDAKKAIEETKRQEEEQRKARQEAHKKRMQDAANNALEELTHQQKVADEAAKQTEQHLSKDFATQMAWAEREFSRKESAEKERIEIQRKYGQISQQEYERQNQILNAQRDTFNAEQLAKTQKFYTDTMAAAKQMLEANQESELAASEEKYNEQLAQMQTASAAMNAEYEELNAKRQSTLLAGDAWLGIGEAMTAEEIARLQELDKAIMENAALQAKLTKQAEKEKAEIKKKYADADFERERKKADDSYALAVLTAENEGKDTSEITRKYLQDKLAEMREYYGEASIEYQNALKEANAFERKLTEGTKTELKNYTTEILNSLQGISPKIGEILSQGIGDSEKTVGDAIDLVAQYASQTFNQVFETLNALDEAEIERINQDYEESKNALDERYAQGLISQEEYDRKSVALEQDKDKQVKQIEYEQAKRNKGLQLFQATITGAKAIAEAVSAGLAFGLAAPIMVPILTALAATTTGLQIAAIAAQPLPQAAKGGIAGGGLLVGPSHAEGGIPIEAEGGEAIINKRSTAKYRGLLSAINADGGGVRFAAGGIVGAPIQSAAIPDGGYSARNAGADAPATAKDIADAVAKLKVYVAVTDINKGQKNYAQIQANKTI